MYMKTIDFYKFYIWLNYYLENISWVPNMWGASVQKLHSQYTEYSWPFPQRGSRKWTGKQINKCINDHLWSMHKKWFSNIE